MAKNRDAEKELTDRADRAAEAPESIGRLALERFRRKLLDNPEWANGWAKNPLADDDYLDDMIVAIPPTETPTIRKPRR